MTPTVTALVKTDYAAFARAASRLEDLVARLDEVTSQLASRKRGLGEVWEGDAAGAAIEAGERLRTTHHQSRETIGELALALRTAGWRLECAASEVARIKNWLAADKMELSDDWQVSDVTIEAHIPESPRHVFLARVRARVNALKVEVELELGRLQRAIADAHAALNPDAVTRATGIGLTNMMHPNSREQRTRDWWAGLSEYDKRRLARDASQALRTMPDLPSEVLSYLNVHDLKKILRTSKPGSTEHERARKILKRYAHDQAAGNDPFILWYDLRGNDRLVYALGDPDLADRTVISIPGTGTDLDSLDGKLNDLVHVRGRMMINGEQTSMVFYLNDVPDNIPAAAGESYAKRAAPHFAGTVERLIRANQVNGKLSVEAHSYGTVHVSHGVKLLKPGTFKAIILGNSPGMHQNKASDFGKHTETYVFSGSKDPIRLYAALGTTLKSIDGTIGFLDLPDLHGKSPVRDNFGGNLVRFEGGHSSPWSVNGQKARAEIHSATGSFEEVCRSDPPPPRRHRNDEKQLIQAPPGHAERKFPRVATPNPPQALCEIGDKPVQVRR